VASRRRIIIVSTAPLATTRTKDRQADVVGVRWEVAACTRVRVRKVKLKLAVDCAMRKGKARQVQLWP
jgi:hypothetical protein